MTPPDLSEPVAGLVVELVQMPGATLFLLASNVQRVVRITGITPLSHNDVRRYGVGLVEGEVVTWVSAQIGRISGATQLGDGRTMSTAKVQWGVLCEVWAGRFVVIDLQVIRVAQGFAKDARSVVVDGTRVELLDVAALYAQVEERVWIERADVKHAFV